jgi:hypothetical protein
MAKEMRHKGKGLVTVGAGLLILGAVKYLGYNWEMALMVIGILAIIKGLICYGMKK